MTLLNSVKQHWRLILFVFVTAMLLITFNDAAAEVGRRWLEERYSHAPFVLMLAIYLIWIKRHELVDTNHKAELGLIFIVVAGLILVIGQLSSIWIFVLYGLVFMLFGLMWTMLGLQTKRIVIPFLHVLLVIPLPYMLDVMLSAKFQLMSSKLGVDIVRLLDIPVFREGNIIDLGVYKLQVVEACSGLNYTYPLMTISLMMAYMYIAPFYARVLLFLTSIPISIVMNSFRIALVAVLVNISGIEAAEGFMHYFEGWVIFILCIAILLIEVKILNIITNQKRPFSQSFDYLEENHSYGEAIHNPYINKKPIYIALGLILLTTFSAMSIHTKDEIIPARQTFEHYPLTIDGWQGTVKQFQNGEDKALRLKDYFLADYRKGNDVIDVYYGYTDSQRGRFVPHSPKVCIPGSGWEVSDAKVHKIKVSPSKTIKVTRLVIEKGENKTLVYYWFRQRGRDLASEIPLKFALLYDSMFKNRSDGSLVRFSMPVTAGNNEQDVSKKIEEFIAANYPLLPEFIPD